MLVNQAFLFNKHCRWCCHLERRRAASEVLNCKSSNVRKSRNEETKNDKSRANRCIVYWWMRGWCNLNIDSVASTNAWKVSCEFRWCVKAFLTALKWAKLTGIVQYDCFKCFESHAYPNLGINTPTNQILNRQLGIPTSTCLKKVIPSPDETRVK